MWQTLAPTYDFTTFRNIKPKYSSYYAACNLIKKECCHSKGNNKQKNIVLLPGGACNPREHAFSFLMLP